MSIPSSAVRDASSNAEAAARAETHAIRPLYWSVRRELWENRAIYVGPLAAAGVFLFGFLISLIGLPHRMAALAALSTEQQHAAIQAPYDIVAGLMMLMQMIVGGFYCLDAFQSERRDRSILFWKSLPVSDLTTVLAKASIPFVVLPLIVVVIAVVMELLISLLSSLVLVASGQNAALFWTHASWFQMPLMVTYHIVTVHTLWYAPFYGWLLLVSAWARRAAYLWALFPPVAIMFIEKIVFSTSQIANMMLERLSGSNDAVAPVGRMPIDPMTHLTPWKFMGTPGLWIGLAVTACFLAAAVRLRRYRDPI